MGATGLEPVTPSVSSKGTTDLTAASKEVTSSLPPVCTRVCTSDGKSSIEALAGELLRLSDADRMKLVAMLLQGPRHGEG
jgi:hypothetical protein